MAPKLTGFPGTFVIQTAARLKAPADVYLSSSPSHVVRIGNSRVRRVLAVAALAGVELEHDKSFTFSSEWKTPEFLEKNPFGFLPILELEDGTTLRECAAIAEYSEFELLSFHRGISPVEWRRTDLCSGIKPRFGMSGVVDVQKERLDCLKDETSISVIPVLMTCVENFPAGGTVIPLTKQSNPFEPLKTIISLGRR